MISMRITARGASLPESDAGCQEAEDEHDDQRGRKRESNPPAGSISPCLVVAGLTREILKRSNPGGQRPPARGRRSHHPLGRK
jgi:hypothetical protein